MKNLAFFMFILLSASFVFSQTYYLNINLKDGTTVSYEVEEVQKIDFSELTGLEDMKKMQAIVKAFKLRQNYPNPFNPSTTLMYEIPKRGKVEVNIFDMNGKLIKNMIEREQAAGSHQIVWKGLNQSGQKVASGFYIYTVKFDNTLSSKKMLLIK